MILLLLRKKRWEKRWNRSKRQGNQSEEKSGTLEMLPLITLTYYITILNEIFPTYNCKFERISFLSFMRASVRNTIPSTKVSFNSALPSLPLPPFFTINSSNSGLWEWSWEVMSHCLLTQLWISRLDLFNPIAQRRLSGNLFNPFVRGVFILFDL